MFTFFFGVSVMKKEVYVFDKGVSGKPDLFTLCNFCVFVVKDY